MRSRVDEGSGRFFGEEEEQVGGYVLNASLFFKRCVIVFGFIILGCLMQ